MNSNDFRMRLEKTFQITLGGRKISEFKFKSWKFFSFSALCAK